jgi:hypothetical protein
VRSDNGPDAGGAAGAYCNHATIGDFATPSPPAEKASARQDQTRQSSTRDWTWHSSYAVLEISDRRGCSAANAIRAVNKEAEVFESAENFAVPLWEVRPLGLERLCRTPSMITPKISAEVHQ